MFDRLKILSRRLLAWMGMWGEQEEFSRELDEHLELLTQDNLRRGMAPEEARRLARVRLGGLTQLHETYREQHGWPAAESVVQDIRYAFRTS